jgi:hypothetical protein
MLETSDNPFALATLAHLETQNTQQNETRRFESKLRFIRNLYAKGWRKERIIELFHFIDWIMRLPDYLESELWVEILNFEEERKMRYVGSVERTGYKRGWDEGKTEERPESIELGLSLKFGDDAAMPLMSSIRNLQDPDRLIMIRDTIRMAGSIDEKSGNWYRAGRGRHKPSLIATASARSCTTSENSDGA